MSEVHKGPVLVEGDAESVGLSSKRVEHASLYVKNAVFEGKLPLAEILIARRNRIVCYRSYIHPQLEEEGYTLEDDSVFYLASFTKILVATLVMQQVEQGNVSLDRSVAEYIPEFGQRGKDVVTVRHLLCHSSGLPDQLTMPISEVGPMEEFLDAIYREPLVFTPGTRGSYCSWGFTVLMEVLNRATQKKAEELAQEELFEPLRMSDTHLGFVEELEKRIVPVFDVALKLHETMNDPEFFAMSRGDIGAYSTTLDIAAFCQAMLNGGIYGPAQILSPISIHRMTERQYPWYDTPERLSASSREKFGHLSKGLGWMVRGDSLYQGSDLMSSRAFFHPGRMGLHAIVDPEYDLISIFMTSFVPTAPTVSAGRFSHTFGSMAFAAVAEL